MNLIKYSLFNERLGRTMEQYYLVPVRRGFHYFEVDRVTSELKQLNKSYFDKVVIELENLGFRLKLVKENVY